ncbi:MAG: CHASE3 domain-containing protein [Candidatus Brocadia sp.]|jgi:methyl-accepting chemotaxis protein
MKLTLGKRIGGSFVILVLISAIAGGLILYWLTALTSTNQTVLSIRTPSMIEAERVMRYYGMAIGGLRGFIASGDEKYLQDFEKAKSGLQESYKRLEEVAKQWVLQENKNLLKEIGVCLSKFYTSANQVTEKRRSPENDVAAYYFAANMAPLFNSINEKIDKIMEELSKSPGTNAVRDAIYASAQYRAGTARLGMAIRGFMESADEKYTKDYEAAQKMRTGGLTRLQSLSKDLPAGLQEIVASIAKDEAAFITHPEKIFVIRRGNDYRLDLKHLREELAPLVATVQKHIDQIGTNVSKLLEDDTQTTLGLQRSMWFIGLIAVGVSVAAGAFMTVFLPAKITTLFRNLVTDLTESASQVASASEEISASSQGLSEATTEQAASIEETSSTMEEISSMTKQNADNASEASKLVKLCNDTVKHGSATVTEMNDAMKKISESSGKIADIIKIIEGIAFQTNLLALNAAVEAARAGEHGRGFAVVAEEVRNLAQRSSTAAKDITALITDSVNKADIGMDLVKKTEEVFSGIVEQVKKVTDLVNEIATASEEQTNGIEQISKAIQQLDQVVQQNAANAEETAAASEELSAQAQGLNALVDKIAAEVNMEGDRGVKPAVVKKKETVQLKAKRSMTPSNKKISAGYREDTSPEGNGKELAMSGARSDRLIPMSNDDFKDF